MKIRNRLIALGAATVFAGGVAVYAFSASSQESGTHMGPHGMGRGMMGPGMMGSGMMGPGMMGPGMMGMGPRMMGAGRDTAAATDIGAIHALLAEHDRIRRMVTNLPDGIRTVTESDDPRIAQLIKDHVAAMGQRVRGGKMIGVPMESETVHAIYANKDKIRTTSEPTATGVAVVQSSDDPKIIALLQEHAREVSALVAGGMAAMHTAMTRGGTMHGGMGGPMPGMHGMMHGR